MHSWSLQGIPEEKRKEHIIACLSEYIEEVDELKEDGLPTYLAADIVDVAELYAAIIKYMKGES